MTTNEALAVLDCTIRMGEVRADHNDKEGREALSVLRAVCEDYEKARLLLYAASNLPEPWGGWELCDDVQLLIEMARDYQKQGREGRKP